MKLISKRNLLLLIPLINDRENFSLEDFEAILDRWGDDWYIVDGQFQKVETNSKMVILRKEIENNAQLHTL